MLIEQCSSPPFRCDHTKIIERLELIKGCCSSPDSLGSVQNLVVTGFVVGGGSVVIS